MNRLALPIITLLFLVCNRGWGGEINCENLPVGSFSRIECERNAARLKALPAPDVTPAQLPQKSILDQICGPRPVATTTSSSYAERKAEDDRTACVSRYLQRIEEERRVREKIEREKAERLQRRICKSRRNIFGEIVTVCENE